MPEGVAAELGISRRDDVLSRGYDGTFAEGMQQALDLVMLRRIGARSEDEPALSLGLLLIKARAEHESDDHLCRAVETVMRATEEHGESA